MAARFYFDTEPAWIALVIEWAAGLPQIDRAWILGSRVRGWRSEKVAAPPVPDLDIAFTMTGADMPALYRRVVRHKAEWQAQLESRIPVPIDLQYAEVGDQLVWPVIQDHGVLIYRRD